MKELTTEDRTRLAESVTDFGHMTDEELLAEYRLAGSPQVFAALVQRYERELYNYLRRFLANTVLAEDAFQATFMQVHLKCHLFDDARKVRPWLYTVATNQAIDIQRRNRRHRLVSLDRVSRTEHQELGSLVNLLRSKEVDPGDQLEQSEKKEWIREAVAALPEQLSTAVRLVYFRGLKYREAAEELSVPVGTVKSRVHSAVKRLGPGTTPSRRPGRPAHGSKAGCRVGDTNGSEPRRGKPGGWLRWPNRGWEVAVEISRKPASSGLPLWVRQPCAIYWFATYWANWQATSGGNWRTSWVARPTCGVNWPICVAASPRRRRPTHRCHLPTNCPRAWWSGPFAGLPAWRLATSGSRTNARRRPPIAWQRP